MVIPKKATFCFNFVHDTQFGDRTVEHPSNLGIMGPHNIVYYVPETQSLQTALAKEGFEIDPYETTGGENYLTAFFGPSTQGAVKGFQKKYGIKETGEVDNDTIDKLASLYSCPKPATTATTTEK
jgi:peptidoglycan hydrolase-like protein with peptidoglycan-binding domain